MASYVHLHREEYTSMSDGEPYIYIYTEVGIASSFRMVNHFARRGEEKKTENMTRARHAAIISFFIFIFFFFCFLVLAVAINVACQ